jgi:hypothetical protein
LAVPNDWSFEQSISKEFLFIKNEERSRRLKFLRHEDGADYYLDTETGKEVSLPK